MANAKIGLVTVLYNSSDVLDGFFRSLSAQRFEDYHLYLIDNTPSQSSNALILRLTGYYGISKFTHIINAENVGVAEGNNQGIQLALAAGMTHTLLLNNDVEFEHPDLLSGMFNHSIDNDEAIIVPKILFFDSRMIWTAGGQIQKYRATTKHIGEGCQDRPEYNVDRYVDYAPTCFMLINNKVFEKVGLMDPKYFVYYDDTDFIYRAMRLGYKILYLHKYTVLHKVSSSTGGDGSLFSIYWGSRNRIYFIRKNYTLGLKVYAMVFTLTWKLLKCLTYNADQRRNTIKGLIDGFKV